MSNVKRNWLYRSIGIIIFILILRTVDLEKIRIIISTSENLWIILLALPLTFLVLFIRFYRWFRISMRQQIKFPLWEGMMIYLASFGLGVVTPGRLGEFIRINYLRNVGCRTGQAFFSVLMDRLSDIAVMSLVGLLGLSFIFNIFQGEVVKIILTCIIIISAVSFSLYKYRNWFLSGLSKKKNGKSFIGIFLSELNQIPAYIRSIGWSGMSEIAFITWVSWLVFFLQNYLFTFSLGINLTFFQIAFITCAVGLINLIPVSISGIGTRDVALVYMFSHYGLEKEQAIVFSACMLLTFIVCGASSLIVWEMKGIKQTLFMLKRSTR